MIAAASVPKSLLAWARRHWQLLLAYGVIPLLTGYAVISRAFYGDGLLPLDSGDEPAETFVQVPMAHAMLWSGDLPKMNLFNNFGTPILGEPVVYPFALHALTYVFLRPVVAMLVNRFLLTALTMIALTRFFTRYFPPLTSSLCAFLTFSSPAFFYFFQNHPHQGALLYYAAVLLALRWFLDGPSRRKAFALYAAFLVFLLSVGINGALLGMGFVWLYGLLTAAGNWKRLGWAAALCAAACVTVYPHYLEFFRLAAESARKDLNYQGLTAMSPLGLFKALLFFSNEIQQASIFYSGPVLVLLLLGLGLAARCSAGVPPASSRGVSPEEPSSTGGGPPPKPAAGHPCAAPANSPAQVARPHWSEAGKLSFLLGLAPCLAVMLCRLFPGLPASLPLIKSCNVSRILWFSDLFLLLAAGLAMGGLWRGLQLSKQGAAVAASDALAAKSANRYVAVNRLALGVLVLLCFVERYPIFHRQADFFLMTERWADFQPRALLGWMKPSTRMATLCDPVPWSHDTKANRYQVLGSAGRSIILGKEFKEYLRKRDLISIGYGGMVYYFHPAPPETLAQFGIRYCLTAEPNEQMAKWGWIRRADEKPGRPSPRWVLYESPAAATPFYVVNGIEAEFLQEYRLAGNRMEIKLPSLPTAYEVVATFLARPGWKAFLDGQPAVIHSSEDCFIRVNVAPNRESSSGAAPGLQPTVGPRMLVLNYEPYSNAYLCGCLLFSLAAAALIAWFQDRA